MQTVCFPFSADIPVGGGHPSAMTLMQSLDHGKIRPLLALHGEDGPAGRWLAEQGSNFPQVRFKDYAGGTPRDLARDLSFITRRSWQLARFLKDEGVVVVHANDIWMMGTWALASKLAGVKLVWHHRSDARFRLAHRLAFKAADRMIAVSPYAAGSRVENPKCVVVSDPIQLGTDPGEREGVRRRLLDELKLSEPVHVLGFFANLKAPWSARKRPLVLVEALAQLKALAPERTFVGAFYGTVNDDFRRQIEESAQRLGVSQQIFLMGFRDPVEPELLAVDTVVAPAVAEGFGRVPVEAMMIGTPVVASDSGNHPELVRDNETGGLVPADDAAALAEKILWLATDRTARSRIVEHARHEAHERFGVEAGARAVMQIYAELAPSGESRRRRSPSLAKPAPR